MTAPPTAALVVLTDLGDAAVLAAAKQGLQQFGSALCLQAGASGATPAAAAVPAAPPRLVLGLCSLTKPLGAPKPVLQVRYRPGPFVLRDFLGAVGRLAHAGDSADAIDGATAASALQQLVAVVAQDAACAAAGPHKTVLLLTDRVDYDPSDFYASLEVCKSKGVLLEVMLLEAAGNDGSGGGSSAGSGGTTTAALAAAWGAAEAAFPHLSVSIVQGASRVSFAALASTLLQRFSRQPQLAVSLQFKQPLIGSIRSLALTCSSELRPLSQAVAHATLCPCHRAPANLASGGSAALCCGVSGAPLDRRQCGRDERTVQVGNSAAGALHLSAPFNIAAVAGTAGGGPATLIVLARIKVAQANPALLFGTPLMLAPGGGPQGVKVVHEGQMLDVSTPGLLALLCSQLRSSQEALLASSTTDLESGASGLLRLHFLLLPCKPSGGRGPTLCAKRVACAEELLAPLLPPAGGAAAMEGMLALSPAVAEAVQGQLAAVPLAERLDPLALSSRCGEVVEMLVRESVPMPRPQAPAAPPAAAPAVAQPAQHNNVAAAPAAPAPLAAPAAAAAKGRRPAVGRAAQGSGGMAASGKPLGGKGGLELKRSARR